MLSECIMTFLILMLGNGWMTRFMGLDLEDDCEIYLPLALLVVLIHIALGALTFLDADAYHKYHDFHGWQGYTLICFKLLIVAVYFYFY